MYPHHRLNSSALAALLQQWTQVDLGAAAPPDIAEHLGQWLSTVDAVTLGRSLHAIESLAPEAPRPAPVLDIAALEQVLQHTRSELTALACTPPPTAKPARARADNTPVDAPDLRAQADFSFHAPRYLDAQKHMEATLGALRARVRHALAQGSTRLRQLAALDAVMEQLMAAREQRLWASLPAHLDRRLAHLRQAHQQQLAALQEEDEPAKWRWPGGWLDAFEQDLQALLLAEMHVRLEPILGLLQAARNEYMERQE